MTNAEINSVIGKVIGKLSAADQAAKLGSVKHLKGQLDSAIADLKGLRDGLTEEVLHGS